MCVNFDSSFISIKSWYFFLPNNFGNVITFYLLAKQPIWQKYLIMCTLNNKKIFTIQIKKYLLFRWFLQQFSLLYVGDLLIPSLCQIRVIKKEALIINDENTAKNIFWQRVNLITQLKCLQYKKYHMKRKKEFSNEI